MMNERLYLPVVLLATVALVASCSGGGDGAVDTQSDGGATGAPAAPTALVATAASASTVALSWTDNSSDETGFQVERSDDGITFVVVARTGHDVTAEWDTGLGASTVHSYRVAAYNGAGASRARSARPRSLPRCRRRAASLRRRVTRE